MKKNLKKLPITGKHLIAFLGCLAILSSFLILPVITMASPANTGFGQTYLGEVGTATQLPGANDNNFIWVMIGRIINTVLGVLGVILVVLVIYAGFMWMTASGDAEKVKKAKNVLIQAVIGIIIIFAAYALANFVLSALGSIATGSAV
jgi:type IV secretory pathway VirB2 component (pilin)